MDPSPDSTWTDDATEVVDQRRQEPPPVAARRRAVALLTVLLCAAYVGQTRRAATRVAAVWADATALQRDADREIAILDRTESEPATTTQTAAAAIERETVGRLEQAGTRVARVATVDGGVRQARGAVVDALGKIEAARRIRAMGHDQHANGDRHPIGYASLDEAARAATDLADRAVRAQRHRLHVAGPRPRPLRIRAGAALLASLRHVLDVSTGGVRLVVATDRGVRVVDPDRNTVRPLAVRGLPEGDVAVRGIVVRQRYVAFLYPSGYGVHVYTAPRSLTGRATDLGMSGPIVPALDPDLLWLSPYDEGNDAPYPTPDQPAPTPEPSPRAARLVDGHGSVHATVPLDHGIIAGQTAAGLLNATLGGWGPPCATRLVSPTGAAPLAEVRGQCTFVVGRNSVVGFGFGLDIRDPATLRTTEYLPIQADRFGPLAGNPLSPDGSHLGAFVQRPTQAPLSDLVLVEVGEPVRMRTMRGITLDADHVQPAAAWSADSRLLFVVAAARRIQAARVDKDEPAHNVHLDFSGTETIVAVAAV